MGYEKRGVLNRSASAVFAFAAALLVAASAHGQATSTSSGQAYPGRPIRLVVPLAPGGPSDILARSMAQKLTEGMKQTVFVENRTGAGGTIGIDNVAKSPPDGYTLLLVAVASYSINASLYPKLPYDPHKDLQPVSILAGAPYILVVHPALPVRNVKELIALDKRRPGELNYSSSGPGALGHLSGELLNSLAKIKLVHIPYKGIAPGIIDLIAGQVQLSFASIPVVLPHVNTGRLRMLAQGGEKRATSLQNVPTMQEAGVPGFVVSSGFSLVGPAGIPRPVAEKLNGALARALQDPANRKALINGGAEPVGDTIDEHAAFIKSEIAKWQKVAKAAGIEPRDP